MKIKIIATVLLRAVSVLLNIGSYVTYQLGSHNASLRGIIEDAKTRGSDY